MPMMVNWQVKGDHTKFGFCEYYRGKKMTIHARKPSQTNVDGECHATYFLAGLYCMFTRNR